jgi:carbon-monoxide dehydrogenase small subunit
MKVSLVVNGSPRELDVPPLMRLLDALRWSLGLTGTKEGCAEGECGACTVLLDGDPVNACLVAVGQCDGREITTVEGLGGAGHVSNVGRESAFAAPSNVGRESAFAAPSNVGRESAFAAPSPLQRCFIEDGGAQCGICTPGMLIAAEHLLSHRPDPSEQEIREALAGNLCRCTGYQRIVESVKAAARLRQGGAA